MCHIHHGIRSNAVRQLRVDAVPQIVEQNTNEQTSVFCDSHLENAQVCRVDTTSFDISLATECAKRTPLHFNVEQSIIIESKHEIPPNGRRSTACFWLDRTFFVVY